MSQIEPFESNGQPKPRRVQRSTVLATEVYNANIAHPDIADKTDREIVAAHFRTLYVSRLKMIDDWASCQTANKERNTEYRNRVDSLQSKIRRESGIELMRVGLPLDQSNDVAAALVAGDDEYRAVMTTLNEKLFA